MKFIREFKLFLEQFTDRNSIGNWKIFYFHNSSHDINDRIIKRTSIKNESDFNSLLDKIIKKIEDDKLSGDYTFISFNYSIKLIIRIKDFDIKIITALGKNENTKKKDKIILL